MNEQTDERQASAGQVERPVRPGAEARWYCLDRDGVAMLCKDEADARAQAIENDDCWPGRAPHRAALLGDVAAERKRWESALKQTWQAIDPLKPAGQPGSYARGYDNGFAAALEVLRGNLMA